MSFCFCARFLPCVTSCLDFFFKKKTDLTSVGSLMQEQAFAEHKLEVQAASQGWFSPFASLQRHLLIDS